MSTYHIIYIDDEEKDRIYYTNEFENDEEDNILKKLFKITSLDTPKNKSDMDYIKDLQPDILLLDYDLSSVGQDNSITIFSGDSLPVEMRRIFPEIPICLFTRRSILGNIILLSDNVRKTIDDVIYKNELVTNKGNIEDLYILITCYKVLRNNKPQNFKELARLLKNPNELNYEKLLYSNPRLFSKENPPYLIFRISKWIREIVKKYPGILYDDIYCSTFLGIDKESFNENEEVCKLFESAKYKGIFADSKIRWWKSEIQKIAINFIANQNLDIGEIRKDFPVAWKRKTGNSLKETKCIFSGKKYPEWVCCLLNEPVRLEYTLPYFMDNRPDIFEESRVSFEAIRISEDFDEELVYFIDPQELRAIKKRKKEKLIDEY